MALASDPRHTQLDSMANQATILPSDTLAHLATTRAGASRVFARHHLDFCCHGGISLADACSKKGIAVDSLIAEVRAEERTAEPLERWDERSIEVVVRHIVDRYHASHRTELPRLIAMAKRVEHVHGDKASCPHQLSGVLQELHQELTQHMDKEEAVLFPMLVSGHTAQAAGPIQVMEREHEDAAVLLEKIRDITDDHAAPAEACGTWRALFLGLAEFERDLMEHVHLENHVLFPRAMREAGVRA
jgi:regulator of cell morphogenesis and NO signaling